MLLFDLNSKDIVKDTQIREGESMMKLGNKLLQRCKIVTYDDYIINIDQHINN